MWYSGRIYFPEEIAVLKEYEQDMFEYDAHLRTIWSNNFEEYFLALFDEEKWCKDRGVKYCKGQTVEEMLEDPEFKEFMQRQYFIDEVLNGDLDISNVPFEVQQEIREIERNSFEIDQNFELYDRLGIEPDFREPWEKDDLYIQMFEWGHELAKIVMPLYEEKGEIHLFRILHNCESIASHLSDAWVYNDTNGKRADGYIHKTGYVLAIKCLERCRESMEELIVQKIYGKRIKLDSFLYTAKQIRRILIDRLDTIEQKRYNQ